MARYSYKGKLINGDPVAGTIHARDRFDLESRLIQRGVFVEQASPILSRVRQLILKYFKRSEITRITRQISLLLESEITVLESLQLVAEQIDDHSLNSIFETIIAQVESGAPIASSFGQYPVVFDELYISMVEAGELSGNLGFAFDRIAAYREKHETTTRKIQSAIAYPLLVVLVAVLVVAALIVYVVPVFSSMYDNFGAELPPLTQTVIRLSTLLKSTLWYWLPGIVALLALAGYVNTTARFKYWLHRLLLNVPLLKNLVTKIITARFCRTMGALLTSDVEIIHALRIASRSTGNSFVGKSLEPAGLLLAEGKSFTDAVQNAKLFPKAMIRLTASGEKTGRLGEMLSRAADYFEREADTEIETVTSLLEPLIIVVLGALIAFILIAMYLPLFELVGTV